MFANLPLVGDPIVGSFFIRIFLFFLPEDAGRSGGIIVAYQCFAQKSLNHNEIVNTHHVRLL